MGLNGLEILNHLNSKRGGAKPASYIHVINKN